MTIAELARQVKSDYAHIWRITKTKGARPSPELAARIEEATDGQVSRLELLYPESTQQPEGHPLGGRS